MNELKINRENFKTLLLAFLVFMSIYFVESFWDITLDSDSKRYSEEKIEENEKSYKLYDVIVPQKTIVSFDEDNRTVIYSNNRYDIWDNGKQSLEEIFSNKDIEKKIIDIDIYNKLKSDRAVTFQFSQELYAHMVGKILDLDVPKEIDEAIKTINSIEFSIGNTSFLVFSNQSEKIVIELKDSQTDNIKTMITQMEKESLTKFYKLEDVLGVESEVYIPVKSQSSIPTVHINVKYDLTREINLDDRIAELFFFKKIEYIRKIEESNGSSIYIDEKNILKIYQDGRLEYIGGIEENNERDLYSSLNKAVEFISSHKGWPDDVYLSDIEELDHSQDTKGYKFIFRYKTNGLTVFSEESNIQDKIEIEVLNGSITRYKSRIWNNLGTITRETHSNTMSAFEVIDNNFLYLKDEYIKNSQDEISKMTQEEINDEVKKSINDIYIAYYGDLSGQREVLNPVWVIEILENRYIFDAYSGKVKS